MAKFYSKRHFFNLFKFIFTAVVPLVAWMALIFVFSSREKVAFTDNYPLSFVVFKNLHLVEYAILFSLWLRLLFFIGLKKPYLLALLLTFAYGLSDELHQSFVVGREGKLLDAFVDGIGGIIAWILIEKNKLLKKLVRI